ncbi:MAG: flippase-like domain-containing protein, partial [Deltaproteobacteria bacterium]|nr:flippase-like domain-containing protein [Deltaproteobacteria bacterium]
MKVLILAAGRSTRLGELTTDRPKAMVKIAGKFLIDYVLDYLNHPSITEIGIVTGYKSKILTEHLSEYKQKPLRIFNNPHFHEGSVRTIMAATDFLDTDFILVNADHIYPKKLLKKYLTKLNGLTIACDFDRKLGPDDMKIKKDKSGRLTQISKTLSDYDGGYIGSSFIPNAKLKSYKEALAASYEAYGKSANVEAIIGHMAEKGHDISIADLSKIGWLEVDTQKDLKLAEETLKKPSILKMIARYVFAIVGISIFSSLIYKMGPSKILDHIAEVGLWIIPALLISFLWYCLYTLAWSRILKRLSGRMGFRELFKIKIIGESLNTLTPLNFVAGDPARAYFLKHRYPFTEAAASVVVDRTLHSISTLAIILIGTAAAFVELKFLPKNIKYGLPIVLAIAVAFVGFIFIHQRKGLFTFLASITKRLRIKKTFSTSTLEKFEEVDGHIQD